MPDSRPLLDLLSLWLRVRPGINFLLCTSVYQRKLQTSQLQQQGLKNEKRMKYIRNIQRDVKCWSSWKKLKRDQGQKEKGWLYLKHRKIHAHRAYINTHIYIHTLIHAYSHTYIHIYVHKFEGTRKGIK